MRTRLNYLLAITCALAAVACHDNNTDPNSIYNAEKILKCHDNQEWTEESTKAKIIGQWEWKHVEYIYGVPSEKDDELNGLKIQFREDLTGTFVNNDAGSDFTWSIDPFGNYFGFSTQPVIPQLGGRILFCDDIMECGVGEFIDGANNYFRKVDGEPIPPLGSTDTDGQ